MTTVKNTFKNSNTLPQQANEKLIQKILVRKDPKIINNSAQKNEFPSNNQNVIKPNLQNLILNPSTGPGSHAQSHRSTFQFSITALRESTQ